ncbi:hypothetical protein [Clostridium sp. CF012]|uniref:hypothetical protein n=1 Tax=Clostridium sp. CF012 TaxID=2843319 RepID=UPI001C0E3518|nr:hypothetical protein [Clostridium sp. CF012]MBU3144904.1 hypothetical protein [Clostridium sp. CF012]
MKKWCVLKKRKGAALVWVLLVFTVLMILMSSVMYIVRQNIFETTKQKERIQTYYIALAGVDLTYAALMNPDYNPKKIEAAVIKLKRDNKPIIDTIIIDIKGVEKGTATVTIDRIKENEINWIKVTSVGQLKGNSTKVPSTMRINEDNNNQIVREKIAK